MSDGSKIEWTDATWNVVIGCDKVSPGCDHCYAIRTAHRFQEHPNPAVAAAYAGTEADGDWTGRVNLVESRLDLPLRWKRPRRIFVNAQSDLFHDQVPDEFIARVWAVMALAPQHTFQVLTKRHGRMRSLLSRGSWLLDVARAGVEMGLDERSIYDRDWPLPNVWLGVSVEDQKRADLRIPALLDTPAAVQWLSCEPLLGPVDLGGSKTVHHLWAPYDQEQPGIDWVVVGGESGPGARPMHPDWARSLRDQCDVAGVPFLFKQRGDWTWDPPTDGRDPDAAVLLDGRVIRPGDETWWAEALTAAPVARVGKRAAGRVLDGRTWDQYPQEVSRG